VLDQGGAIPAPTPWNTLRADPRFKGWLFAVVDIDPALLDDRAERIDITLPRRVLARLDAAARAAGETHSGYIAKLALARWTGGPAPRQRECLRLHATALLGTMTPPPE